MDLETIARFLHEAAQKLANHAADESFRGNTDEASKLSQDSATLDLASGVLKINEAKLSETQTKATG